MLIKIEITWYKILINCKSDIKNFLKTPISETKCVILALKTKETDKNQSMTWQM